MSAAAREVNNGNEQMAENTPAPTSPSSTPPPGAFPISNGGVKVNGDANDAEGGEDEEGPQPPPHKTPPNGEAEGGIGGKEEAEERKAAGNKFYKAKQYQKAVEEYSKGMFYTNFRRG